MTSLTTARSTASAADSFSIDGDLPVNRLGCGTMQVTGTGVWGQPADHQKVICVLHRSVELSVNLIDTVDAFKPFVTDALIGEALHPYLLTC